MSRATWISGSAGTVTSMIAVDVWVFHDDLDGAEMRARITSTLAYTSVSHSSGRSVLAACDVRVGIDVEYIRWHAYQDRLVARCMTEAEQDAFNAAPNQVLAFTQHGTRVEAYLKALGVGISGGLLTRPASDEGWSFIEVAVGDEHCATVVVNADDVVVNVFEILDDDMDHHESRPIMATRTQRFAGSALGASLGAGMIGLANALEGRVTHDAPIVVEQAGDPDGERVKLELDAENPKASKITFRRDTR